MLLSPFVCSAAAGGGLFPLWDRRKIDALGVSFAAGFNVR